MRARREALARAARGEAPLPGDQEFLEEAKAREEARESRIEEKEQAREEYGEEASFSAWWMTLTEDVQALLLQEVEEPEGATFSHKTVQRMAQIGSTDRDIATLLRVDRKRLVIEAREALELGRTIYRFLLTHRQMKAGMAGDRSILIWLGKQKLGQVDRVVSDHNVMLTETQEAARRTRAKFDRVLGLDKSKEIAAGVVTMLPSFTERTEHDAADA